MNRCTRLALTGLLVAALAGCGGSSNIKPKGRVLKGGQPFHTAEGQGLRLTFIPLEISGERYDSYPAIYNGEEGTFEVTGKDGTGLPPGKYRVGFELMKKREDQFKGRYLGGRSPYTCEVHSSGDEVVIDLDNPPARG